MFVCLFVCFLFESSWETHGMISWKFCKYLTWFGWYIVDLKCLFVCCLFAFCLNHLGIPRGIFHESFMNIFIGLAEILSLKNMCSFIFLFVCLFAFCLNHLRIPTWRFLESFIKIQFYLAEILLFVKWITFHWKKPQKCLFEYVLDTFG